MKEYVGIIPEGFGEKGHDGKLLLATCLQRRGGICQQVCEVPSIRFDITLPSIGANLHNVP